MRDGGVSAGELDAGANDVRSRTRRSASRASARSADTLDSFAHYTGDPGYLPKDMARYEGATTASVTDAARTLAAGSTGESSPSCAPTRVRRSAGRLVRRTP